MQWQGKVAVITGAGGVLCSEIAKEYAKAGASVALLDINLQAAQKAAEEINAAGGKAKAYKADCLSKSSLEEAHKAILSDMGKCDLLINGIRQSIQLLIFSEKYEEIADHINRDINRGVTILNGMGWYSKQPKKVIVVLAKRTESTSIFRLVKQIDSHAFISQSNVIGVYGEGFDKIKT